MTTTIDDIVMPFEAAASAAHKAESSFLKEFDAELTRRKREREFAFRRLGLIRELTRAAACESEKDNAIAGQIRALCAELGWQAPSDSQEKALAAFRPVAEVIFRVLAKEKGKKAALVMAAFAAFEAWYAKERGEPFLALLDHELPELPLVDF